MGNTESLQLFEDRRIRTAWNEEEEKWYFSIVDIISVLTDSVDYQTARKYWNKLKQRLSEEGNESVTNCHQLKLTSPGDGKKYLTDVADTEQLFRLIQSVPSKKAEPDTFEGHMQAAADGGSIARNARLELEAKTGKQVVTPLNAKDGIKSIESGEE